MVRVASALCEDEIAASSTILRGEESTMIAASCRQEGCEGAKKQVHRSDIGKESKTGDAENLLYDNE